MEVRHPVKDRRPILPYLLVSTKAATGVRWLVAGVGLLKAQQERLHVLAIHGPLEMFESCFDVNDLRDRGHRYLLLIEHQPAPTLSYGFRLTRRLSPSRVYSLPTCAV